MCHIMLSHIKTERKPDNRSQTRQQKIIQSNDQNVPLFKRLAVHVKSDKCFKM